MKRQTTAAAIAAIRLFAVAIIGATATGEETDVAPETIAYLGNVRGSWKNSVTAAANELSRHISVVLGRELAPVSWEKASGPGIILVTESKYVPDDLSVGFKGSRRDAFMIRHPYVLDGRTVCLLVANDQYGYDYPVYFFLKHFMNVDWVGPGELGEVIPSQPGWTFPGTLDVFENPDFEMRLWADRQFRMARPLLAGSSRMGFHHAFGSIYAPAKYAESDPDIYPLIAGERRVPDPKAKGPASPRLMRKCANR